LKTLLIKEKQKVRAISYTIGLNKPKVKFVLRYTRSFKHCKFNLKSKHSIHVIHESEDYKTIPAQKDIRL